MISSPRPRGFSLVELLVIVVVCATVAALLIPALKGTLSGAQNVRCLQNVKSIGAATLLYSGEHNGTLPMYEYNKDDLTDTRWQSAAHDYIAPYCNLSTNVVYTKWKIWKCPGDQPNSNPSYSWNSYGYNTKLRQLRLSKARTPQKTFMWIDCRSVDSTTVAFNFSYVSNAPVLARHRRMVNAAYLDGHAESLSQIPLEANDSPFWFP